MRSSWALVVVAPAVLAAQSTPSFGHATPVPMARAVRRTSPITLDAKLDEPAWQVAQPITEFVQVDPDEGKPATQRTDVRILYDDDALYIGAKMYDDAGKNGVRLIVFSRAARAISERTNSAPVESP